MAPVVAPTAAVLDIGAVGTMSATDVMLTKAVISVSTQALISKDVNLVKVAGDTFLSPVVGSTIGNSSSVSAKAIFSQDPNSSVFSVANESSFRTGMMTDLTLGALKSKIPVGNLEPGSAQAVGQATIDATVEINSQTISNTLNENNNCEEEKCD